MKEYSFERLKETAPQKENTSDTLTLFCKELSGVPEEYYNNIFFPEKLGTRQLVITDIKLEGNELTCNVHPIGDSHKKRKPTKAEFQTIRYGLVQNIIHAIEVAEISRKRAVKEEKENQRIKELLEKAEKNKQNKKTE